MDNARPLLSAALRAAGPPIGSVVFNEAKLCSSLRDDIENLKQIKVFLQWRLINFEDQNLKHRLSSPIQGSDSDRYLFRCTSELMKTLKSVVFDIEDTVNEYYHSKESLQRKNCLDMASSLFSMSNPIISRFILIRKVNSIGDELRRVQDLFQSVESLMSPLPRQINLYSRTSSAVIGREEDFNMVMELIDQKGLDEILILAVVAPPGFGKSSLVRQIYCDSRIANNFKRIWLDWSICLLHPEEICREIILKSGKPIDSNMLLKDELKTVLHNEDCFIVLDGLLGDHQTIADLKQRLATGHGSRSKIIVTTHSQKVAKTIVTVDSYRLPTLSEDVCCKIIQNTTRCADDDELFMEHRESITSRCNGIPLVAEFIGSVLATGPEIPQVWKLAKDEELWKVELDFSNVPPLLQKYMFIYYKMPQNMRFCFAYCSIFSKALGIKKHNLTRQWQALDMIETGHNTLPLEVITDQYVEEMKALFLFEASQMPTSVLHLNHLAYDLARSVASAEIIILSEDCKGAVRYCDYRFIQLSAGVLNSIDRKNWPVKARSLVLKSTAVELKLVRQGTFAKKKLVRQVISRNQFLRVLDLRECCIQEIPSCVYHLNQLRYLDASGLPITKFLLPRNRLQKLESLDLSDTSIKQLPDSISNLKILSFLSLRGCQQLLCLPKNFGSFDKLQFLDLANCVSLQEVPESFEMLRSINHLDLSGCRPSIVRDGTVISAESVIVGSVTEITPRDTETATVLGIAITEEARTHDTDETENTPRMSEIASKSPLPDLNKNVVEIDESTNQNHCHQALLPCEPSPNSTPVLPLSDGSAGVPSTGSNIDQGNLQNKLTVQVNSNRQPVAGGERLLVNQSRLPHQMPQKLNLHASSDVSESESPMHGMK